MKRKDAEKESPLASLFQKIQTALNELNKARETYVALLPKGKALGLDVPAQAEPVRRSEHMDPLFDVMSSLLA